MGLPVKKEYVCSNQTSGARFTETSLGRLTGLITQAETHCGFNSPPLLPNSCPLGVKAASSVCTRWVSIRLRERAHYVHGAVAQRRALGSHPRGRGVKSISSTKSGDGRLSNSGCSPDRSWCGIVKRRSQPRRFNWSSLSVAAVWFILWISWRFNRAYSITVYYFRSAPGECGFDYHYVQEFMSLSSKWIGN